MNSLLKAIENNDINDIRMKIAKISSDNFVYYDNINNKSRYIKLLNIYISCKNNYKKMKKNMRKIDLEEKYLFYRSFNKIKLAGDIAYYKLYLLNLYRNNYEKSIFYLKIFYKYRNKYKFNQYFESLAYFYVKINVLLSILNKNTHKKNKYLYLLNKIDLDQNYYHVKYYLNDFYQIKLYYFLKYKNMVNDKDYISVENKYIIRFILKSM